jgi:DNA modification methylase
LIKAVDPAAYKRGAIWYKPNSMGQLTGDRPAAACEGVAVLHGARAVRPGGVDREKMRWHGHGSYAHWACNGTRGEPNRHPNQKPLALLVSLVRLFSDPGELIFDPFCGSGRVGEAALLCGRHYVGWDQDERWVVVARERCAEAEARFGEKAEGEIDKMRFSRPKDGGGIV